MWLVVIGGAQAVALRAHAQPAVTPQTQAIGVVLRGDPLSEARVLRRLGEVLERPVSISTVSSENARRLTITWRRTAHELAVSYDVGTRTVARIVSAPESPERVVETAVFLAANLVREDIAREPPADAPPDAVPTAPRVSSTPIELAPRAPALDGSRPAFVTEPAVVSLAYPMASNWRRPGVRTHFELNALYGRVGALEGLQLGAVGLVLGNEEPGAAGTVRGAQLSLAASAASGNMHGAQISLLTNVAGSSVRGLQLGGVNVVAGSLRGVQLGVVNVTTGSVQGTQLGLVNYAKRFEGLPLGIVSVTEDGGVHPLAWSSSAVFGNVGVKFATRYTYTMPYLSVHHAYDRDVFGGGGAIGGRIPLGRWLRVEVDIGLAFLRAAQGTPSREIAGAEWFEKLFQPRLRAAFHAVPAKHFSAFVGAGLLGEVRLVEVGQDAVVRVRPEIFAGVQL